MKFRFTAEHFTEIVGILKTADLIAARANALLDAEEAKCERVYGHCIACKPSYRWFKKLWHGSKSPHGKPTYTALLLECGKN